MNMRLNPTFSEEEFVEVGEALRSRYIELFCRADRFDMRGEVDLARRAREWLAQTESAARALGWFAVEDWPSAAREFQAAEALR